MAFKGRDPLLKINSEQENNTHGLIAKLNVLKGQILSERVAKIKQKKELNAKKLASEREETDSSSMVSVMSVSGNTLYFNPESAIGVFNAYTPRAGDRDCYSTAEAVLLSEKRLPYVEKIPRYITWVFLPRNQKAYESNSLMGKPLIYYSGDGEETLICSDNEEEKRESGEEKPEKEDLKYEFSEGEDRIVRLAFEEYGLGNEVANLLKEFVGGTNVEIQERYKELKEKNHEGPVTSYPEMIREKRLCDVLDSYNSLFCRRCKVFDCRLHGCGDPVFPQEKQQPWSGNRKEPCGRSCYLQAITDGGLQVSSRDSSQQNFQYSPERETNGVSSPSRRKSRIDDCCTLEISGKGKCDYKVSHGRKHNKRLALDALKMSSTSAFVPYAPSDAKKRKLDADRSHESSLQVTTSKSESVEDISYSDQDSEDSTSCEWKPLEKDLLVKGIEIFGTNSCLIARNLLSGWKTCSEVHNYMHNNGASLLILSQTFNDLLNVTSEDKKEEQETPERSKPVRRKGKARRRFYSTKAAARSSVLKKNGKGADYFNYSPCDCYPTCSKGCPCLDVDNCCEKFCGCPKSCKNRFRGCHCAKSQCRTQKCPCYASNRECDPDVCRNCWVTCGDGTIGEPLKQGESQCGNMRILLRQQQRILLGRSDVTGWGVFIKNSVNKNEYLGEYTGELISHDEADRRGKVYDRVDKSFLFNVNDEYVLDAFREGDKLKFANHSSKPNCYCKVIMVQGDHRIAIFSKERIAAKQELFYNYSYSKDTGPAWAHDAKMDASTSKGLAKKHPAIEAKHT